MISQLFNIVLLKYSVSIGEKEESELSKYYLTVENLTAKTFDF